MIDFYSELDGIAPNMSVTEIRDALNRLSNVWNTRLSRGTNDDKAHKMLGLIGDAYKAFADDTSRRKYDRELTDSKAKPETADPNAERAAAFKKWYADAEQYKNGSQFDLAKTAVEKAMQYIDHNAEDADFYALAADVYKENGDIKTAFDYINKAIVIAPDDAMFYVGKAFLYQAQNDIAKERETLNVAIERANRANNDHAKSVAYGYLAHSLYFKPNGDERRAEEYANIALSCGDAWGNAKKVMDDINGKREEIERKRQMDEYKKEQERKQAAERRRRNQELQRISLEAAEKKAKRNEKIFRVTAPILAGLVLCVVCFFSVKSWLNSDPNVLNRVFGGDKAVNLDTGSFQVASFDTIHEGERLFVVQRSDSQRSDGAYLASSIRCINLDGSFLDIPIRSYSGICVRDGWIYYVESVTAGEPLLYKVFFDGTKKTVVCKLEYTTPNLIALNGEWLYLNNSNSDYSKILAINIGNADERRTFSVDLNNYKLNTVSVGYIDENCIIWGMQDNDGNNTIIRTETASGKNYTLAYTDWRDDALVVSAEWVYFQNEYDAIYRVKTDGAKKSRIVSSRQIVDFVIEGEYCYYRDEYHNISRVNTGDSSVESVLSLRNDYILSITVQGDKVYFVARIKQDNNQDKFWCVVTDNDEGYRVIAPVNGDSGGTSSTQPTTGGGAAVASAAPNSAGEVAEDSTQNAEAGYPQLANGLPAYTGSPTELRFTWYALTGSERTEMLNSIIAEFMKVYPNIKVIGQPFDAGLGAYFEIEDTGKVDGKATDMIYVLLKDVSDCEQYLEPLDTYLGKQLTVSNPAQFDQAALSTTTLNGKLLGVPLFGNIDVLVYNETLLDSVGADLPADNMTWDELIAYGKELKTKLPKGVYPFADNSSNYSYLSYFYAQEGTPIWTTDGGGKTYATVETAQKWLKLWADMRADGLLADVEAETYNETYWETSAIMTGNAAIGMQSSGTAQSFSTKTSEKLGAVTLPGYVARNYPTNTGSFIGVNTACANKEAAALFVNYITTNPLAQLYLNSYQRAVPYSPTVRKVNENEVSKIEKDIYRVYDTVSDRAIADNYSSIPNADEFRKGLLLIVQGIANGQTTVEQGAKELQALIERYAAQ